MSEHFALLVADEARRANPHWNVRVVQEQPGKFVVKCSEGTELVRKFEGRGL